MRHLRLLLLAALLAAPLGCGSKSEDKSDSSAKSTVDAKSPEGNTAAKSTPANKTPKNTVASNTPVKNTPNNNTPVKNTFKPPVTPVTPVTPVETAGPSNSGLPSEYSALAYIPSTATALVSVHPGQVLSHKLLKLLPEDEFPLAKKLDEAQQETGIDFRTLDSLTLAFWMGDGHAMQLFPGGGRSRVESRTREAFPQKPPFAPREEIKNDCAEQPENEFGDQTFPPGGPGGPGGPGMMGPPPLDFVIIAQFSQPIDLKALEEKMPGEETDGNYNGLAYRIPGIPQAPAYYMPNDKTLVLTHRDDVAEVLGNKTQGKAVQAAVKNGLDRCVTVVALLDSFRDQVKGPAMMADEKLKGVAELPDQLESVLVSLDLKDGVDLQVLVDTNDEKGPQTIKKAYDLGYGMAGVAVGFQLPAQIKKQFGEETGGDLVRIMQDVYANAKGEPAGKQFKLHLHVPASAEEVVPKVLEVLKEQQKALQWKNNLKMVGIGCHNYHDVFKSFPFPAGRADAPQAEKGKLSWRVHILPFIDQQPLYDQFKLDEAWDSKHNKALLEKMPDVYKLAGQTKPGYTQFVAPAGKGFMVDGNAVRKIFEITDGTSNTIMVLTVKEDKAEPWTKPGGLAIDPAKAAAILGGDPQGFLALFADGSVQAFDSNIAADKLKALLTIAGGEPVDRFER